MHLFFLKTHKPRLTLCACLFGTALLLGCGDSAESESTDRSDETTPRLEETYVEDARWWVESELLYTSLAATGQDGTAYFGAWDGNLYAVAPDGTPKWSFETDKKITAAPAVAPDGSIIAGSWDSTLYAVNADGSEKWNFQADSLLAVSPSIDADGRIYIVSDAGTLYRLSPDGEVEEQLTLPGAPTTSVSIFNDGSELTLFVGGADKAVHCISETQLQNEEFSSSDALGGQPMDDIALDADGFGYAGTADGNVVKVGADCSLVFTSESLTYASTTSPTLDDDNGIYVGLINDRIARVDATDGSQVWTESTRRHAPLLAAPTLSSDGKFYAGANGLISFTIDGEVTVLSELDVMTSPLLDDGNVLASTESGMLVNLAFEIGELGESAWPIQHGNAQRTGYLRP